MSESQSVRPRRRAQLLGAAALVCVGTIMPLDAAAQRNAVISSIRGQVLDTAGKAIPHVLVEYMDGTTSIRAQALSDEEGRFQLANVPAGSFRLRATRIGYTKVITPYWRVQRGEALTVIVRVQPEAVVLAPLEITAKSRSASPVLAGFYDRAQRKLGGTFITRAEIEARSPFRITDLLVAVPGVEVINAGGQNREVRFGRSSLGPGGGTCKVQIFVDGVLATRSGVVSPDELVSPGALEGIEIHRGLGSLPPEFVTPDARCGVIALWTRRGG